MSAISLALPLPILVLGAKGVVDVVVVVGGEVGVLQQGPGPFKEKEEKKCERDFTGESDESVILVGAV